MAPIDYIIEPLSTVEGCGSVWGDGDGAGHRSGPGSGYISCWLAAGSGYGSVWGGGDGEGRGNGWWGSGSGYGYGSD